METNTAGNFISISNLQNQLEKALVLFMGGALKIKANRDKVCVSYNTDFPRLDFNDSGVVELFGDSDPNLLNVFNYLIESKNIVFWNSEENYGYYNGGDMILAKLNMFEHEFKKLSEKIGSVDVENLSEKIEDFENKCDSLESDLSDLSSRVDDVEGNSDSDMRSDVRDLESRVSDLEYYDISDMNDRIKTLEDFDSDEISSDVEDLKELKTEFEEYKNEMEGYKQEMEEKFNNLMERINQYETGLFKKL